MSGRNRVTEPGIQTEKYQSCSVDVKVCSVCLCFRTTCSYVKKDTQRDISTPFGKGLG